MELIDRYLQSVKWMLPRKQQDDVIRELSDEILSQVEEKEAALGRPLTEDEQAALLKQLGHPMLLASRYSKRRYLIDPSVFAIYWMVLRLVLVVVFFAKWDPRTLPKLTKRAPQYSMRKSIASLIAGAVFGVWWLVGLKYQFLIFGPGIFVVHVGPVWQTLYPLFVVIVLVDIARHTLDLLRPDWQRGRIGMQMLFRGLTLLSLYFLIRASELFVESDAVAPKLQPVMKSLNYSTHLALIVFAIITVAQLAWDIYNLLARRNGNGEHSVVSL